MENKKNNNSNSSNSDGRRQKLEPFCRLSLLFIFPSLFVVTLHLISLLCLNDALALLLSQMSVLQRSRFSVTVLTWVGNTIQHKVVG